METKIVAITVQEFKELLKEAIAEYKSMWPGLELSSLDDELWDRRQAANYLGISEQTITKLVKEEKLVAQRSGRKYHFLKSNVLRYLNRLN